MKRHQLIYGNQPFEIKKTVSAALEKLQGKYPHAELFRLNCLDLTGAGSGDEEVQNFIAELQSRSLFDDGFKIIYIRNLEALNEPKNTGRLKAVVSALREASADPAKILIADALIKKIPDLHKDLQETVSEFASVKTLVTYDSFDPSQKIIEYARHFSVKLSQEAVSMLALSCGGDLEVIHGEIAKLALVFLPEHEISLQDITLSVGGVRQQQTLFKLCDSVVSKNIKAFIYTADRFADDKPQNYGVSFFSALSSRYLKMNAVLTMLRAGIPEPEIKKNMPGTHSFVVDKAIEETRLYQGDEIEHIIGELSRFDLRIKFTEEDIGFLNLRQVCLKIIRGEYVYYRQTANFCRTLIY